MSPAGKAFKVYQEEECSHSFLEMLELCLAEGYVHSTPEYFVAAREVSSIWDTQQIVNPLCEENHIKNLTQDLDCWHIHLMAGDMAEATKQFPHDHKLISFERRNQIRFYDFARFFNRSSLRSRELTF